MDIAPVFLLKKTRLFAKESFQYGELSDNYARIKFYYCALCGSDLSTFEGRRNNIYPLSLGHEFVAKVHKLGRGVKLLSEGDIVTTDLNFRCGECIYCIQGQSHLCSKGQIGRFSNRGFALYADIHSSYLTQIPTDVPKPFLSLTEPLSCVIHAANSVNIQKRKDILIIGAGGLGSCLAFYLTVSLKKDFEITDVFEERLNKIATCLSNSSKAINTTDNRVYDLVFDVSGSVDGLKKACQNVKKGGTLCLLSHLDGYGDVDFLLPLLTRKDITLKLSYLNGCTNNINLAIKLLIDFWDWRWNKLLNVQSVNNLQHIFNKRRESEFNKEIVDLGGLHT